VSADPRWFTPRSRHGDGGVAERTVAIAGQLGLPVLPWQRQVLETALERTAGEDSPTGRPAFRDVIVSVPRQSGKSTLALSLIVERMMSNPNSRILYSAQTRSAAREMMLSSWWPRLLGSPLAEQFKLFRGFGAETISHENGSQLQLLSATESAGHGETTDLVIVDEAWVHVDARVEQSVRPTMATRRDAQFWIMSTAGTPRSLWWKKKLEAGRAAAEMGIVDGTACFD
jgi:phage terminase large subunit-like protein